MQTTKLDGAISCPACNADLNASSGVGAHTPGAKTLCGYCAAPLVFTTALHVRPMREDEFEDLPAQVKSDMTNIRLRILSAKAKRDAQH